MKLTKRFIIISTNDASSTLQRYLYSFNINGFLKPQDM